MIKQFTIAIVAQLLTSTLSLPTELTESELKYNKHGLDIAYSANFLRKLESTDPGDISIDELLAAGEIYSHIEYGKIENANAVLLLQLEYARISFAKSRKLNNPKVYRNLAVVFQRSISNLESNLGEESKALRKTSGVKGFETVQIPQGKFFIAGMNPDSFKDPKERDLFKGEMKKLEKEKARDALLHRIPKVIFTMRFLLDRLNHLGNGEANQGGETKP